MKSKEEEEEEQEEKSQILNSINTSQKLNTDEELDNNQDEKKKNCCKFPSAYTILIIFEVFVFILLYIIPRGKFDSIEYSNGKFIIKSPLAKDLELNATQKVWDDYGINIKLENFEKGYIKKPIAIPNTYHKLEDGTTYFYDLFLYPIKGLINSADISFFLFVLGGNLNILIEMEAFSGGMAALSRITKGRGFLLAILVFISISIGGSTFGMSEETWAFYPILTPIFLKSGLDGILSMVPLYMGSLIGYIFSTLNPFNVVLGSYSAGINFIDSLIFRVINFVIADVITILYLYFYYRRIKKDETKSATYNIKKEIEDKFLNKEKNKKEKKEENDDEENPLISKEKENKENKIEFTLRQKIALFIFFITFIVVIVGVIVLGWWFNEMTAGFFISAIILIFISGKGEDEGIKSFVRGGGDFFGVALVIGIGRGINITLDEGKIIDTILYYLSKLVTELPKIVFAIAMLFTFFFLGFFIQSSTAMAVLSMPIFAPLADNINCKRDVVINAFIFGQNFIGIITPAGSILIVLQFVGIKFNYWFKFIWPFMIILFIY